MTMAGRFPEFGKMLPGLAVRRVQSERQGKSRPVSRLAFHGRRFPRDAIHAAGLARAAMADLKPLILCGQQSLSIFCAGVFLSFAGHFSC